MLKKYLELFEDRYEEPQEIVIMGTFSKIKAAIATGSAVTTGDKRKNDQGNHAMKTSVEKRKKIVKSHDIRSMFKKQNAARAIDTDERPAQEEDSVVILD